MDITTVSNVVDIAINIAATVGGSAVLAAVLPKPTSNTVLVFQIVRKVIDFIGANWLNAKNSE